jgi:GNAT superfamily N-acetyltransferase
VGRIALLEHRLFNAHHGVKQAHFYLFEAEHKPQVAEALFSHAEAWARGRGLNALLGPKGFSVLDGFGVLIDGFEHRQMMSLTNYNYPYYAELLEGFGFRTYVDLISCYLDAATFQPPAWLDQLAAWAQTEHGLYVHEFPRMHALVQAAPDLFGVYNHALAQNWEYYPFPAQEIAFATEQLQLIAQPRLMKMLKHGHETVGVFVAFPDLTPALQRARGRLNPLSLIDLLLAVRRRPSTIAIGVLGVLPAYRLCGGNALLFAQLLKTATELGVQRAELLQIPETALEMRRDLASLGIKPAKTHRVYVKQVDS